MGLFRSEVVHSPAMQINRSAHAPSLIALAVGALALFIIAGCAAKPPEQQIIADAADALGGRDRILAVKTIVIEGEGTNGNLGQDMTMEANGQVFNVTGYRRAIDVQNLRSRTEQTRTPNFAYFQGPQAQKQLFGVADGIGYTVAPGGTASRTSHAVAQDRTAELFHHPLTIVRASLDPDAKLTNPRTAGSERVVDLETKSGLKFTLAIDATSKLPTRVVSMTDNANLGDVAIETSFADYQDVKGLKSPARFVTKTDAYQTATLRAARQTIDEDAGDLAAPQAAASAAAIAGPSPANVTVEEVVKGVWFLAGQSHHSVVVEFADHLTLVEAPQSETRTLAVIAKARELRPGKPLTEVVNSHHHFDHSAGVRAAIAEGLTILTHKANAAYLQQAAGRAHTIAPDALSNSPKPAKVVPVDGEMTLKDASMIVVLYPIDGNPHGDAMLMAYLPRERILVEVDAFSAGSAVQPYAANLVENITRRKLIVDRIVPLHGALTTYAELVKSVPQS
jgi:glyoxylase-like metal-dependent hydrolase (beta-lactamase superfamily II)